MSLIAKLICVRHGLGHRGGLSPWIEVIIAVGREPPVIAPTYRRGKVSSPPKSRLSGVLGHYCLDRLAAVPVEHVAEIG